MKHDYDTIMEYDTTPSSPLAVLVMDRTMPTRASPVSMTAMDDFESVQMPMKLAIYQKRYDVIQERLTSKLNGEDPNEEILFQNVYMTGLEYSIYNHDWKMAIIFYIHAADPRFNCFDGRVVDDTRSENGHDHGTSTPRQNMYHMCENNGMPIEGFKGLYCLLNPISSQYSSTLACLWLMEQCHNGGEMNRLINSTEGLNHVRDCMRQVGAGCVWNDEFCKRIFIILISLRKASAPFACEDSESGDALPHEICLHILDYAIDDILSFSIWRCLMYVSSTSVETMKVRSTSFKSMDMNTWNMNMDCS